MPDVEIVAMCDVSAAAIKKAQARGIETKHIFKDYREMMRMPDLDAVVIGLPNYLHAPVSIAALKAGKHVLCEKPIAESVASGKKIVDAAKRSRKAFFMMGYNNRFRGDSQWLKKCVEAGELGRIYYAKCGWVRRVGIPGGLSWFTKKKEAGGGPMIDLGVHVMDLTMWLMGFPKPVSAFGASYAELGPRGVGYWGKPSFGKQYEVEDLAHGLVKFANGASMVVETSWAQHTEKERVYVELYGTEGGACLEPLTLFSSKNGGHSDAKIQPPDVKQQEEELKHFIGCIREGKQPMCTAEQGLVTMKIIDGIYKSAKTGGVVKLT
jgi:predicted dehydrogenase